MYRNILVVHDGSARAPRVFDAALALARAFESQLHLIIVEELPRFATTIGEVDDGKVLADRRAAFFVGSAESRARGAGVTLHPHVVVGRKVEKVIECAAEHRIDLLVLGASRHFPVWELLFGNPTERLTRLAACSAHIVK